MQKIIIGLVAVGLSISMMAGAQMNGQGSNAGLQDGVEAQQLRVGAQGVAKTAYPRLATSSEAVQAAIKNMQVEREAFKAKIEGAREEMLTKREQEREALKTKLQGIQDEKKKAAVQKLDENMNKLNSNFVERWTKNLSDFDIYLSKLVVSGNATSTVVATSTTSKDLTSFNTAIESAKTAIVSARTAVEAQSKKSYNIAISTEANLKSDVSSVRDALNKDLKAVKDLVQAAHLAVVKALTEFNKVK